MAASASVSTKSRVYSSPIGPLKLTATDEGILAVKYLFGKHKEVDPEAGNTAVKQAEHVEDKGSKDSVEAAESHLDTCSEWLDAYFQGSLLKSEAPPPPRPKLTLPQKGHFFQTVWDTLINTSVGDTLSYKELATLSGSPKAYRSVGQAVKSHHIPILIPCHRVVKSEGRAGGRGKEAVVGNYSGGDGTTTKTWLIEHEKKMAAQSK